MAKRIKYVIGIDEVGRGSLAGPVTVAVVMLPKNFQKNIRANPFLFKKYPRQSVSIKLRDSKKLSPKQRKEWFKFIKKSSLCYSIASVSPKIIDKINISRAANLAATRAFQKLVNACAIAQALTKNNNVNVKIFLDGGLYLNESKTKSYKLNPKTIVRGDEKIPAIALASIVAKVVRDRMMEKLHKKYPEYGFDRHKGYGTKYHFKMIKKHGLSLIHRRSFKTS